MSMNAQLQKEGNELKVKRYDDLKIQEKVR
jgi:hypothetical protein